MTGKVWAATRYVVGCSIQAGPLVVAVKYAGVGVIEELAIYAGATWCAAYSIHMVHKKHGRGEQ